MAHIMSDNKNDNEVGSSALPVGMEVQKSQSNERILFLLYDIYYINV